MPNSVSITCALSTSSKLFTDVQGRSKKKVKRSKKLERNENLCEHAAIAT